MTPKGRVTNQDTSSREHVIPPMHHVLWCALPCRFGGLRQHQAACVQIQVHHVLGDGVRKPIQLDPGGVRLPGNVLPDAGTLFSFMGDDNLVPRRQLPQCP
jgi:hypothetical protein